MKLLSNTLLVEHIPVTHAGSFLLPDAFRMKPEDGSAQMYRLIAKANPEFEAEPGDNLLVRIIAGGPTEVGENRYVLRNPDKNVLAVIPRTP